MPLINKKRIKNALTSEPLRRLVGPLYQALTSAELLVARAVDARCFAPPLAPAELQSITAVVKAFERPRSLERLLDSLAKWFPGIHIIVADDSRISTALSGVEVVRLPFDSGVSVGRQAALDRVRTPYTWLLDDDFVLYSGSRLDLAFDALQRHPELDLVGGPVINLPLLRKSRSNPGGIYRTPRAPRVPLGPHRSGLEICDKVPNYYLARTERLKLVGWTPELKRLDHADFFTRARGVLVTAYCDEFRCLHIKTPFDREYMRHRLECDADRRIIARRYVEGAAGPRL
jgi:glycosyltransferase involved in cell wall biosynthesis